jgi:hypothetical protein
LLADARDPAQYDGDAMGSVHDHDPAARDHDRPGLMRRLLGAGRREMWQKLADGIGGQFVDGGLWRGDKVLVEHGPWTITLDTFSETSKDSSITYTRLRAPYVSADGFRFTIYRRSFLSPVAKLLGMQDIEIGDEAFDEAFIVKSNSETRVRRLLANRHLRQLIAAQPSIYMCVKDDEGWFGTRFAEGVDELYFHTHGIIKEPDRLKGLYELFAETLDELLAQRLARDDDPGVKLG